MSIYLDYNATSPILPEVLEGMIDVYRNHYGNSSSRTHTYGQDAKRLVEEARKRVAYALSIDPAEVTFTSGSTESNNLAIQGLVPYGVESGKNHMVTTVIEHSSVLEPMHFLEQLGFKVDYVPVDFSGRVDLERLLSYVNDKTLLVSIMHGNNETGVIQPVKEIGEALAEKGVYFHIDASQTFGKLILELRSVKYDLLSCTAHKIYGPQGVGALIARQKRYRRLPIKPLLLGGGQEKGLRPGTVPVALVAGFGIAVEACIQHHDLWKGKFLSLRRQVMEQLDLVNHLVNGDQEFCLDNCINISFPGVDSEALMMAVRNDLALSNGSACTSYEYRPSHVLKAMGCPSESSIRISWGPFTEAIDLTPALAFVREFSAYIS